MNQFRAWAVTDLMAIGMNLDSEKEMGGRVENQFWFATQII
jgi:hypothetical protein